MVVIFSQNGFRNPVEISEIFLRKIYKSCNYSSDIPDGLEINLRRADNGYIIRSTIMIDGDAKAFNETIEKYNNAIDSLMSKGYANYDDFSDGLDFDFHKTIQRVRKEQLNRVLYGGNDDIIENKRYSR